MELTKAEIWGKACAKMKKEVLLNELKPCPFCGCKTPGVQGYKGDYWIICPSCGIRTSTESNAEIASKVWNCRVNK